MKKKILLATIIIASTYANAQVTSGLVAQYSFNSGNATDDIGSLDGTVNGAVLTTDRFGNPNKAYKFTNGENITLPDNAVLKSSVMTVSLWVDIDGYNPGANPENFIYSIVNSQTSAYFATFAMLVSTSTGNYFSASQNNPSESVYGYSANTNTGNWQHYVMSIDNDSLKMYVDGQKQWSYYKNFTSTFTTDSIYIGKSGNSTYVGNLNGSVDDIKVYNRVLNSLEVDSLFNAVNPTVGIYENNLNENSISIFPNPTNSVLNIAATELTTVSIVNVLGQELMNAKIQGTSVLDVSTFETGIYFVKDLNSGKTIKFIKQ